MVDGRIENAVASRLRYNAEMADDQTSGGQERRKGALAAYLAVAALALPPLYVLSYGPALLLVKWGLIQYPYTAFNLFYKPLDWPCHYVPGFSELLRRYADLFTK
jgi:hypothetical protein